LGWFLLGFLLFPSAAEKKKQSAAAEEESETTMLVEEVEVVGQVELNKAIQSITLYSEKDIRRFSSDGLKSFLNQCPGFLVLNGGHFGQMAYTYARGASVNQTLVLIDGFKITDPSSSIGLNTTFFSPYLIEKAEIVRGPLSNIYGSNAMGGVINLKTREKEGIELTAFAGSHGTYEGNLYLSKKADNFKFILNGNLLRYSDGVENDEFSNRGITLKAGFQNDLIQTTFMFLGNFSDSGIPLNLGIPTPNREYSQDNLIFALPFTYKFSESARLNIKLSHNRNQYDFNDPDDTWTSHYLNKSVISEGQISLDSLLWKHLRVNTGIDYADQKITNQDQIGIMLDEEKTHYMSAFLNTMLDLKKLFLSASIRYDKYQDLDRQLSPQFGFSYLISDTFKVRGSYSRSFRAPTLPELLNPMWGNPDLKPEKGSSLEFGLDIYTQPVTINLVYFDSKYENLIGYSPVTWTYANLNQADISGIELSASLILIDGIRLWASYTYLHTYDVQNEQELLRRPKHSVSAMISYQHRTFTISGEMIYVGKRLDYDELLWETAESPAFNTFNFKLSIPLNEKLSLIGKATNAFNHEYQEVLGYPAPGSRFILGIKYKIM
jgi:vitamin B12 transporter